MANILPLTIEKPAKLGFRRAQKRRRRDSEGRGQLNLFTPSSNSSARILSLPSKFTLFEEALWLDERGEKQADKAYLAAISAGDCVADAYCNLGILESKAGRSEKAFDCFTRSLKEDPRHLESHYNLGNLYFEMDNLPLARQHYEIAAEIEPNFRNIYFNLGLVLAMSENLERAIDILFRYQDLASTEEGALADELLRSLKQSLALKH
ncbi:tetratricopeptide repeat protein [bacterium]|nr:tetratricopeptide repeat protein [bacterium]